MTNGTPVAHACCKVSLVRRGERAVAMQFRLLGPLEVLRQGRPLPLGGAKQKALLAVLLIHHDRVVSADRLIDEIWGDEPPPTAAGVLQSYISRLRKVLEASAPPGSVLSGRKPGYVLTLGEGELDVDRFDALRHRGAAALAGGMALEASAAYREALALFRGPPLANFTYEDFAAAEIERLDELRVATLEDRIEADLAAGLHAELVGELEGLIAQHPFRERLRGSLILALYRAGRQAEALHAYQATRDVLVDELGIDPSPALQRLERAVLTQDPALEWTPASSETGPPTAAASAAELNVGQAPEPGVEGAAGMAPPLMPPDRPPTVVPSALRRAEPIQERKVVSVLVCGSTAGPIAAELDPEDLKASFQPFQDSVRRHVERYGGSVERVSDGAVVAVFGAPTTHEDDAERAIRAGLAVLSELSDRPDQGDPSPAAIGIATGTALVTIGAAEEQGQLAVVGGVLPRAARLRETSNAGAIVVDDATFRLTKRIFEFETLDPVTVRGMPEPVPIFRATAARSRFGIERPTTPFIGREDELAQLRLAYRRALREPSIQLVTIVGEPGVGKSRLVAELSVYVDEQEEAVSWRQGRCLPYGEGITFWSLGEIVKAQAGILESDRIEEARAKLAEAVAQVVEEGTDREWMSARLGPLVGLEASGGTPDREEAFAAWRRFLEGVAAARPLVAVVEDLHWADAAMLEFVEHLVEYASGVPLLVVATARPELYERAPNWGGGARNAATISLAPLTESECARLISALLDQAVLDAGVQSELLARAGGNPLYAEEFARMLSDRGLLLRTGRVVEVGSLEGVDLPDTVQALIAARLDTLSADRKGLLQDAAVMGKVFWSGAVAAIAERDEPSVRRDLHELARRELIRPARLSSMEGEDEYGFWHGLVRDVCYSQIPRAARAVRHQAAAAWIEHAAGGRVEDYAEILAFHYTQALELARAAGAPKAEALLAPARQFLVLAGDRAMALDVPRAEAHYRAALELGDPSEADHGRLLATHAGALHEMGRFEEADEAYGKAIAHLRERGDDQPAGEAMVGMASVLWGRDPGRAREVLREALGLLEPLPPSRGLVLGYISESFHLSFSGQPVEALSLVDRALTLARELDLQAEELRALHCRGYIRLQRGDPSGLDDMRGALDRVLAQDAAGTTTLLYNNLAEWVWPAEGPEAAVRLFRDGIEFAEARGQFGEASLMKASMTGPLIHLGQWDEALAMCEQTLGSADQAGPDWLQALIRRASLLARRGQRRATENSVQEFLPRALAMDSLEISADALSSAAVQHSLGGEPSAAISLVRAFADLERGQVNWYRGQALPDLVRICREAGDVGLARELLEEDVPEHLAGSRLAVAAAQANLSELTGDHEGAHRRYCESAEGLDEFGWVVERAQALLGQGRCLLTLGRTAEAARPLRDAQDIFGSLGAKPSLAETNALLQRATALTS